MSKSPLMARYVLLLLFFCCSCATVFNSHEQQIQLHTNEPTQLIVATDTLSVKSTQHFFSAKRKKEVLPITIIGDSLQRYIELQTHDSFAYIANYFNPNVSILLGYLIDRKADKRFAYPTIVSVDLNENQRDYYDYNRFKKAKQLLKFTPIKFVGFHNASIEVAYERTTGEDFSTQLMASYLLPSSIADYGIKPRFNTKGFRFSIEERFYFKKDAPYGPYFALELDYLKKKHLANSFFSNQESIDTIDETMYREYEDTFLVNTRFLSTNFKFGYQKEFEKIFVDFYLGIGRRYRTTSHKQRDNPSDFIIVPHGHFNLHHNRIKSGKSTSISLPLNLRIGWRF